MMNAALHRWLLIPLVALAAMLTDREVSQAQTPDSSDLSIELVDPKVLRVCADPRNLPFSNEKGEGFENKLGELFAEKLQKKLDYMYFPQATGFVRMTLAAHRCDRKKSQEWGFLPVRSFRHQQVASVGRLSQRRYIVFLMCQLNGNRRAEIAQKDLILLVDLPPIGECFSIGRPCPSERIAGERRVAVVPNIRSGRLPRLDARRHLR